MKAGDRRRSWPAPTAVPLAPLKTLTWGPPPGPGAGDDVGAAVAVDVAGGHEDAAREHHDDLHEGRVGESRVAAPAERLHPVAVRPRRQPAAEVVVGVHGAVGRHAVDRLERAAAPPGGALHFVAQLVAHLVPRAARRWCRSPGWPPGPTGGGGTPESGYRKMSPLLSSARMVFSAPEEKEAHISGVPRPPSQNALEWPRPSPWPNSWRATESRSNVPGLALVDQSVPVLSNRVSESIRPPWS